MTAAESFPRAFGRYTLLGNLAQGGMGALYLACQGETGMEKLCVVKTVLPELADKEYVARFRDEAKVVVRLSHGNLVPVFDAGVVRAGTTDELYLAMEHVDGKDLRAVWNRCAKKGIAFPVDVAVYIARELARGLHHAHSFGAIRLVHRDVSPPNILLSFSGEVKLTDFGLAASTLKTEKTSPGIVYGKVSYMSPEQARGEPLDGRTDLYAVGIILWELLTGKQLFPQSESNLIDRVRAPTIEPPSKYAPRVNAALDEIVMRALAPDRVNRYADCEHFRAALAGYLAREAPTLDNDRVAGFLRQLFGEEIEQERATRQGMIDGMRKQRADTEPVGVPAASIGQEPSGLIGTMLDGRYLVKRRIGEGGMGAVFEAEHVEIGRRVAVKVLHSAYSRTPEVVARFRSEARAATRIGHPHIIDVFDSGTTVDGQIYIVMEFLEGADLADVMHKEAALPQQRAIAISREICQALAAAHKAGIVHRDMKPENVFLVDRDGRRDFVKVLDFGIAKTMEGVSERVGRLTEPGLAMGTPEYMAPEQAAGGPVDARADVYAVGAILYEMLSGRPPHEGANIMEVLTRKATQAPTPISQRRPDVNPELERLVMQALAPRPEQRPQSMDLLAQELGRLVDGPSGVVRGTTDRVRVVEGPSRRLVIGAASSLALIAALVAFVLVRARELPRPTPTPIAIAPSPSPTPTPTPTPSPSPSPNPSPNPSPSPSPSASASASASPKHSSKHSSSSAKLAQAREALLAGQLYVARDLFEKQLAVPADRARALVGLAEVAFGRGDYAESAKLATQAVGAGAGTPAKMALGNAQYRLKQYDLAIASYRAVLKANPNHKEARENLALAESSKAAGR